MSSYTIPTVRARDSRGEHITDVYSHLLHSRVVYLGTPIDDGVANVVIAQLLHLNDVNAELPINLYINSPGGSLTAMLAIHDTMRFVSAPIATTCVGQAVADAAVLLAAGEPDRRAVLPHGRVVLRQPHAQVGRAAIPDLIVAAEEVARQRAELEAILARLTGRDPAEVRADLERDLVLPAERAVAYGVVDQVVAAQQRPGG